MRLSEYLLSTLREAPKDADTISHKLMLRSGMIKKLASGIYEFLPLGLRALRKVENIIREEMDKAGGQELYLPALLPKELWEESGRWELYGKELMRLKDRNDREFCLGPTHEEIITDLAGKELKSYRSLPKLLYQFQIKFRDEIRPRFGVMRAREFYMKDAYSFNADEKTAEEMYRKVFCAYDEIFRRCGLKFRAVEADTGAIGGSFSHEFMVIANSGEEGIVSCQCGYAANIEKAELRRASQNADSAEDIKPLKEVETPGKKTVQEVGKLLKVPENKFIKSLIYENGQGEAVMVLVRGDCEINETKLKKHLGVNELFLAGEEKVRKITGAPVGFTGPMGLKGVRIIADYSVEGLVNGVSGANKQDYHLLNINMSRDYTTGEITDLRNVREGDGCIKCGKKLDFSRGIEVGHTFKLGTKYSDSMKAVFLDSDGKEKPFIMGCYGIGVSRIVAAAIEQGSDERGIIWPVTIAPFNVIVIPVNYEDARVKEVSEYIYKNLKEKGYEALIDDRDERPGVKFNDADLIGIPVRVVVGEKSLKENMVELSMRNKPKEVMKINPDEVENRVSSLLE